jgi:hypothetical protein
MPSSTTRIEIQRLPSDQMLQRVAVEQLHHDEQAAAVLSKLVNRADVRMIQRGCGAGFAFEALSGLGARGRVGREELDRDLAAETFMPAPVDDAHAAAADLLQNAIVRDGLADHVLPRLCRRTQR